MAGTSETTNGVGVKVEDTKIVVVMVGLPARGKSLIAQKSKLDSTDMVWIERFGSVVLGHDFPETMQCKHL